MSNLFPDEEIRIKWIATFKDEAQGMTGWYRRATNEFRRASAEQVRSEKTAQAAARESAIAFRENQREKIAETENALLRLRRLHRDEARLRRNDNQGALAELAALRDAFKDLDTRRLTSSRTVAAAQLQVRRIIRDQTRDIREADRNAIIFSRNVQRIREEAVRTGTVSEESFRRLESSFRRSGQAGSVFKEELRRAGLELRKFGKDGKLGFAILGDNERRLGRTRREMARASDVLRGLGGWFRFSTNEMILFNQTLRVLRIPLFVAALGLLTQALGTAAGGVVALASALAPLGGLIAGIAPVAVGAAQAFAVWKIATDNLGKSSNNLSKVITTSLTGSAKDFKKLLSQLPPTAREFALELRSLQPGFAKFREQVSAPIFQGLTDGLRAVKGQFGGLRPILVNTARIIGDTFAQLGDEIGRSTWTQDIQTAAKNTNRWMLALQPSVLNVARAFRDLSVAAAPIVTHLVDGIDRGARAIARWTAEGRRSGRLGGFFKETNFVLDRTLSILGEFGKALLNIGKIAYRVIGRQLLADLDKATARFQEWTESPSGVRAITKYFQDLKSPLYEAGRLAVAVAKSFVTISRSGAFEETLKVLRVDLLPALEDLFDQVQNGFTPAVIDALSQFIELLSTLSGATGGLTGIARVFGDIAKVLNTLLDTVPGLRSVFLGLLTVMVSFRALRFVSAITGITLFGRIVAQATRDMRRLNAESLSWNRRFNALTLGAVRGREATTAIVGGRPVGRPRFGSSPAAERLGITPATTGIRGILGRTNLRAIGGGVGLGALAGATLFGGDVIGGRAGQAVSAIGGGALTGFAVGGPWGALVGGLAGAALSLKSFIRSSNGLADAAKRAATALDTLAQARRALPGARLDVSQARLDVRRTSRELRQGRLDFGLGRITSDDLKQLQINAARARDTLNQAVEARNKLAQANRKGLGTFRQVQRQFRDELADITNLAGTTASRVPGSQGIRVRNKTIIDRLKSFAKEAEKASLPGLARIAKRIQDIIERTGKIPNKKQIEVLIKTRFAKPDTSALPSPQQLFNMFFPDASKLFPGGTIPGTGLVPPPAPNAGARRNFVEGEDVSGKGLRGPRAQPTKPTRRGGGPHPFSLPDLSRLSIAQIFGSEFGSGFSAGSAGGLGTNFSQIFSSAVSNQLPRDLAAQVFGAVSNGLTGGALSALQETLASRAKDLMARVAAHPKNEKLQSALSAIEDALGAVQEAIGQAVGAMVFEAQQAAQRITRRADRLERLGQERNIDPDSPGGVQLAQQINRIRIRAAKTTQEGFRQALIAARRAGAAPEDIESIRQQFLDAQDQVAQLLTDSVVNQFKRVRARRQLKLDRATQRESFAAIATANLEARQRAAGSFDTPAAAEARRGLILKQADAAKHTENVLRESLKRAKQQHLTIKERMDLQLQIAQKHSEYLGFIADATEETAKNTIPKISGQLAFGFANQITTDAIASGVGA